MIFGNLGSLLGGDFENLRYFSLKLIPENIGLIRAVRGGDFTSFLFVSDADNDLLSFNVSSSEGSLIGDEPPYGFLTCCFDIFELW